MKKGVLRNFIKFTGKHLCQSLCLNKVAGIRPATFLKKRLWDTYFPVNFCEISKNTFLTEHLWTTASEHHPALVILRNFLYRKLLRRWLKSDPYLPKKLSASIKASKNDEKCFLFHLKSCFRFLDFFIHVIKTA